MTKKMMNSVNSTVIFIHIPRTAGTSLQTIAREQYQDDEILRIYGRDIDNPQTFAVGTRQRPKWVTGHIAYGLHAALGGEWQYVTFLRDPIERTLSVYHYIKRSPGHHLHKYAKKWSLIQFLESGITTELDNGMVRQISGVCGELPQEAYSIPLITYPCQGTLEKAKANLTTFAVVGITEHFQRSLLQFQDVLDWDIGDEMVHINTLRGRPHIQDIGSLTLEAIKHYTRLDRELYKYGLELFDGR